MTTSPGLPYKLNMRCMQKVFSTGILIIVHTFLTVYANSTFHITKFEVCIKVFHYCFTEPKQLPQQVDAITKIQQLTRWIVTLITFVTNVRRHTTAEKHDAMPSSAVSLSTLPSWFVVDAATWQGLRCVQSTELTFSSTSVVTVARRRSSSASVQPTSATPATTIFNA